MRNEFKSLLGWINDEEERERSQRDVRNLLHVFVQSFDGSEHAGFIEASVEPWQPWATQITPASQQNESDDYRHLRFVVEGILRQGFDDTESFLTAGGFRGALPVQVALGVTRRLRGGIPKGRRRRVYFDSPGTYTMRVRGQLRDLVPFLVMHALVAPGAARIARCPAPEPFYPDRRCGRFFTTGGKGQPRIFCSDRCRVRQHQLTDVTRGER